MMRLGPDGQARVNNILEGGAGMSMANLMPLGGLAGGQSLGGLTQPMALNTSGSFGAFSGGEGEA